MTTFEYDDCNDRVYEVDERGQKKLVRSTDSNREVSVRFTNKTTKTVDVWWRDFSGNKCYYSQIQPGMHYDVETYNTHPWEFTDACSGKRFLINHRPIFLPPHMAEGDKSRTVWNISEPECGCGRPRECCCETIYCCGD